MKRGVLIGIFRRMLFVAAAAVMTAVVVLCGGCSKETPLRVLYWNIQNGMWADQGNNYDNFVEWVKRYDPDVCVWCEAQTIYEDGTNKARAAEPDTDTSTG